MNNIFITLLFAFGVSSVATGLLVMIISVVYARTTRDYEYAKYMNLASAICGVIGLMLFVVLIVLS